MSRQFSDLVSVSAAGFMCEQLYVVILNCRSEPILAGSRHGDQHRKKDS